MNSLTLIAALALAGSGQSAPTPEPVTLAAIQPAERSEKPAETPDRLREEAYDLFDDQRSWNKAARLLERSADLRGEGDLERTGSYLLAARLYTHTNSLGSAQRAFGKAAEAAAQVGAVAEAANAFLDAAMIASLRGENGTARALIRRSVLLAKSPHLSSAQRTDIVRRIPAQLLDA